MSASDLQPPQFYSPEEIQQILQLAIARQADKGELSRQHLWEIATELEIEPRSLEAAEQDWLKGKVIQQKRQEFDRYRSEQFKHKAVKYLIANVFFVSLNLISAGMLSWSLYILLLWGLKLTLDAWNTFQVKGDAYEKDFQNWYLKGEIKRSLFNFWDNLKKFWQS
jgi:hypothetical protein